MSGGPKVLIVTAVCDYSQYTLGFLSRVLRGVEGGQDTLTIFDGITQPAGYEDAMKPGEYILSLPVYGDVANDPHRYKRCARMRDAARTYAYEHDYDFVYFHDSDVVPPKSVIADLSALEAPITTGLYCHKSSAEPVFPDVPMETLPIKIYDPYGYSLTQISRHIGVTEARAFGMGCMLIAVEALKDIPFEFSDSEYAAFGGEDFNWCARALALKYGPVLVDASVNCYHVDDSGVASIVEFGELTSAACWNGPGYQIQNAFGLWIAGQVRYDMDPVKLDLLGPEFSRGRGRKCTVNTVNVEEALTCYQY